MTILLISAIMGLVFAVLAFILCVGFSWPLWIPVAVFIVVFLFCAFIISVVTAGPSVS